MSGASRLSSQPLNATDLKLGLSGASSATLSGKSKTVNADLSGASRLDASELVTEDVIIETSGASNAEVHATKTLSGDATGASRINYLGSPQILKDEESGSSRIRAID